jgi:replicative DNA helicase
MKTDERLSGALQENILTLLVFDDKNCKMVRAAVTPQLFESSVFREVVGHAIDFIDLYGEAIKDHLPDHLESILKGDDARKAEAYKRLVDNLYLSRESVNGDYVISQLHKFVRQQNLKSALIKAVEAVEDGRIDQAEIELHKGLTSQAVAFEPGLSLSNAEDVGNLMDDPEEEGFELGIPELDAEGLYPRRKELTLLIAPRGRGKSWFITHCAKQALLQRWSVLIVTLEMSEKRYATRMLQAFFSISRRHAQVKITRLNVSKSGDLTNIVSETIERMTLKDDDIRATLVSKAMREFRRRPPFRVKQFPSGSLTLDGLEAYLEGLTRFENFNPDLICVDYPDLMKIDPKNLRLEIGAMIVGLRGIAVKRNVAMVAVSQGNRESETASTVTADMSAEDISKLATADLVFTLSQTLAEKALGLARLLVDKSRNEVSKISVLMSQALAIGQFCLDSVRLRNDYWDLMESKSEAEERPGRRRPHDDDEERRPRGSSRGRPNQNRGR